MINVFNSIEAFRVKKINEKVDKKFLQRELFVSCGESFLAMAARKLPKNMPAKFEGCAFFVPVVFFSKGRSLSDDHDGQTFFFPEVLP